MWNIFLVLFIFSAAKAEDLHSCGGFIRSEVPIDLSKIMVKLHTPEGNLKYETDVAPNNGYYMIPVYSKGSFLISVHPPEGWQFEPESVALELDGVSDPCSHGKDINFNFAGFGVTGKVRNANGSPATGEVKVELSSKTSKETVLTAVSGSSGTYIFKSVLPGDYSVRVSQGAECLEKTELSISVKDASVTHVPDFIITGSPVQGKVLNEREKTKGVAIFLIGSKPLKNCAVDKALIGLLDPKESGSVLCTTVTDAEGQFSFPCTPEGEYSLVARYKVGGIAFQIKPESIRFKQSSAPLQLKEAFEIEGFAAKVRVVLGSNAKGVPNVQVKRNGQVVGKTDGDGFLALERLTYGQHQLEGSLPDAEIAAVTVQLSAKNHVIPDLKLSKFRLCGSVRLSQVPDSLKLIKERKIIVKPASGDAISVSTDEKGDFCHMLAPGAYSLQPFLRPEEKEAGLALVPTTRSVSISDGPVKDILFRQFQASISGSIKCIVPCKGLSLGLMRQETRVSSFSTTSKQQVHKFQFSGLLPGDYHVLLDGEDLCWKERKLDVSAEEADVGNLQFEQTGYRVRAKSSNDAILKWELVGSKVVSGSQKLSAGEQDFCLPVEGEYEMELESCHRFANPKFRFTTEESALLNLLASEHRIQGVVVAKKTPVPDLKISVLSGGVEKTTLGPLKISRNQTGNFEYDFEIFGETNEAIEFVPVSKTFLFTPEKKEIQVKEKCITKDEILFSAELGEFLEGKIAPPLAEVEISAEKDGRTTATVTGADGKFSLGPFRSKRGFRISAHKDGYVFASDEANPGNFKASKLSELIIKVTGESDEALDAVLISLSGGGSNYRSNNLTGESGELTFVGLEPGEYFVRPVLKEYRFEPQSKMVSVAEGSTVRLVLKGARVAFRCSTWCSSVWGRVGFLSGVPVEKGIVKAVSENCDSHQEEGETDSEGRYRIRGLQPGCDYNLNVDESPEVVGTIPSRHSVRVTDKDVEGEDFVVKPIFDTMEMAGRIICSDDLLPSIRVTLVKEEDPETAVQSVQLQYASSFYFLNVPMDGTKYLIKMESSLSTTMYEGVDKAQHLVAADAPLQFVTFDFHPRKRNIDAEVSRSGYLIVPFAVLLIGLAYNYSKVVPVLGNLANSGLYSWDRWNESRKASPERNAQDSASDPTGLLRKRHKMRKT